jgi:elongation factor P--beta-lysine ligase
MVNERIETRKTCLTNYPIAEKTLTKIDADLARVAQREPQYVCDQCERRD